MHYLHNAFSMDESITLIRMSNASSRRTMITSRMPVTKLAHGRGFSGVARNVRSSSLHWQTGGYGCIRTPLGDEQLMARTTGGGKLGNRSDD